MRVITSASRAKLSPGRNDSQPVENHEETRNIVSKRKPYYMLCSGYLVG